MDRKLVEYFEEELTHVRRMAEEFKHVHPQVAERLQLGQDPPDPYVQQLLDGFAYLTARIQLKLDAEFPRFTEALLQVVQPHYLAPLPSMCIVGLEPEWTNADLAAGPVVRRGTCLNGVLLPGDSVRCRYSTAHNVRVFPVRLVEARYFAHDLAEIDGGWGGANQAQAAVRLRFQATAGLSFNQIDLDNLAIHIRPNENLAGILYEQLLAHSQAVVVQSAARPLETFGVLNPPPVRPMGFEEDEALLPPGPRTFSGYRLLREYFAFPSRYLFIEVSGLRNSLASCQADQIDLIFALRRPEPRLERRVQADCFALHCVPAINLFPVDNIIVDLSEQQQEHQVIPDKTKTLDYEVFSVENVVGRPRGSNKPDDRCRFVPFYFSPDQPAESAGSFSLRRVERQLTDQELRHSPVSDYLGSDVYLSLSAQPLSASTSVFSALHVSALCTNRHVPMRRAEIQFDTDVGAPVTSVRTIAKTDPQPAHTTTDSGWRIISHLALNYRSLLPDRAGAGASALRELLRLYVADERGFATTQIRALRDAVAQPVFRRLETGGPAAFARGLEVTLDFDETPFADTGVFLFTSVLERIFARYVTLNSFTQTILRTEQRGHVFQWPIQKGKRRIL
jgi:type VI secretion system protein ImpG